MSSLKGLGFTFDAYPALKRWAIFFRPAARDWFNRLSNILAIESDIGLSFSSPQRLRRGE
jgi:hypothetical protein